MFGQRFLVAPLLLEEERARVVFHAVEVEGDSRRGYIAATFMGGKRRTPDFRLHDAVRDGDVERVKALLANGISPKIVDHFGHTALHCAAQVGSLDCARLLLNAGTPLEARSESGRTALYMAAELNESPDLVRLLLDQGAEADISDRHGNHILVNAFAGPVKKLLSSHIGKPLPKQPPRPVRIPPSKGKWRAHRTGIRRVFERLNAGGLVALETAGDTQDDAFADCSEQFLVRGGEKAGLWGFCFYTRQDLERAKAGGGLSLGFGGADGSDDESRRAGEFICKTFRDAGFAVEWDGTAGMRPEVKLS